MTIPGTDPRDSDPRRWGLPVWGQRDEGPRNTYVPGPLPTAPLVNTYQWLPRVLGSGVIFGGVATLVLLSDQNGKVPAALLLLALWAAYGIPTWWKGGSGLRAVGGVQGRNDLADSDRAPAFVINDRGLARNGQCKILGSFHVDLHRIGWGSGAAWRWYAGPPRYA